MADLAEDIRRLARGAAAWGERDFAARASLALDTARSVARAADAWVASAVGIKLANESPRRSAVHAEETATGPLATLRLLLITARALTDMSRRGLPHLTRQPRLVHGGSSAARVAIDVLPAIGPTGSLYDGAIFSGHSATVRCVDPGGVDVFTRSWREEVQRRPRSGGVALVLGAGNVTGLAPADCLCQIFEHGRSVLLKLHPLHTPLAPVLGEALGPLVNAGLLAIHGGGVEVVNAVRRDPAVTHIHLTGGNSAFDAIVWGGRHRSGPPALRESVSCELGNVTPWIVVPGRYPPKALARQADLVAASIINNTSFNCIATKLVVTARSWQQRDQFVELVRARLSAAPARPNWYPGASDTWAAITGQSLANPRTLPWHFQADVDVASQREFIEREWFVPVVAEVPLVAASIEEFCVATHDLVARLPGSLAASVTLPPGLSAADGHRTELLIEHLPFGSVAVNTWSALAYAMGSVPWGGYPGATLASPKSGIGFVHDPLCLPLVHNSIIRGPLIPAFAPAWLPWHQRSSLLARGLVEVYARMAEGGRGLWPLIRMLPAVLAGDG